MSLLLELAERCEAATGHDRDLDAEIRRAAFGDFTFCGDEGSMCAACLMGLDATQFPDCGAPLGMVDERTSHPPRWQDDDRLPAYTASLDAAMTLVADGYRWGNADNVYPSGADAFIDVSGLRFESHAATCALALSAAALRARASVDERAERQDREDGLGPQDASAVTAQPADAQPLSGSSS